jgi:transcriptional regulator with XRE-family HTH domain
MRRWMKLSLLLRECRKEVAVRAVDRANVLRDVRFRQQEYAYLVRFAATLLLLLSDRIEDEEFGEIWHFLDRSSREAVHYGISFGTLMKVVGFLRLEVLDALRERAKVSDLDGAPEEEKELLSAQFDLCISKIVDSFEKQMTAAALPGSSAVLSGEAKSEKKQFAQYAPIVSPETLQGSASAWERSLRDNIIAGLRSGVTFGSRMKELRRNRKITLRSLAERLGFARGYISNIENGKTVPSFTAISAISKVLDPSGSGSLILLGMIERLPQEVREVLILGREGAEKGTGRVEPQQTVMPPAESEWEEETE